jgi:hypothetical protein
MGENMTAALFIMITFIGMLLLTIVLSAGNTTGPIVGFITMLIDWWAELSNFQLHEYGNYGYNNTNIKGENGVNYGNWNTPSYKDVWVQNYIKQKDGEYKLITAKLEVFTNLNDTHEWSWLPEQSKYGWKCPKPPAEPSMFMTSGAVDDVQAILDVYNANKTTASTFISVENDTKSNKSVEIDENKQQNAKVG